MFDTPPPEDQKTQISPNPTTTFSWKPPENYTPKKDYYADLVMSYSAMTDIIDPKSIHCEFGDIRILDSCMLEQSLRLNELTHKILDNVTFHQGNPHEKNLRNALLVQRAFRENYTSANRVMNHRYIASTNPL